MAILKKLLFIFCTTLFISATAQQPTIKILESGKRVSIRGLSVVNDDVIWASGSAGSVAISTDGGTTFTWMKVPGYEKMDFRDIEAFDSNTAIIMGITAPAVILKTKDGGKTWKTVFEDTIKGAFLDAMYFKTENNKQGQVIGDPVFNQQIYTLFTSDQGDTWKLHDGSDRGYELNTLNEGEAFFASSGTNFMVRDNHFQAYVSGGKSSRLFTALRRDSLPIMQGKESTGANSIAVYENKAVIVGGDFTKDTISSNNCVLVNFHGLEKPTFSIPKTSPHGYRSCVIYLTKNKLLTCGTSGVDISRDGGKNWELIAKDGFHVCQKAKKGKAVFLAGGNGKIAKLVYP